MKTVQETGCDAADLVEVFVTVEQLTYFDLKTGDASEFRRSNRKAFTEGKKILMHKDSAAKNEARKWVQRNPVPNKVGTKMEKTKVVAPEAVKEMKMG